MKPQCRANAFLAEKNLGMSYEPSEGFIIRCTLSWLFAMMHYSPVVLFFTSCTHSWVIHSCVIPLRSWFSGFLSLFSRGIYASVYVCAVRVQLPLPFRCSLLIMEIKHRYTLSRPFLGFIIYHLFFTVILIMVPRFTISLVLTLSFM